MAFTMHSHSGQFCPGHAKDKLEDMILHAISRGFRTIGLTEHMPRTCLADLYPEELEPDPQASLDELIPRHWSYIREARRLQEKYRGQIDVLVGFEAEFIRGEYAAFVRRLADGVVIEGEDGAVDGKWGAGGGGNQESVDYFIGSLHHGAGVPIDLDRATYDRAVAAAGGDEEKLFVSYYDQQFEMLQALRPPVVGHFDLIGLLSEEPGRDLRSWSPDQVWNRVRRNLDFVAGYGGWLECNTSALRKGLAEPYPGRAIAEEWLRLGGKFTFSDDSHGIAQVATNYVRGLDYLESLGVTEVWTFERRLLDEGERVKVVPKSVKLTEFRATLKLGGA